jgi:hypothetical protein
MTCHLDLSENDDYGMVYIRLMAESDLDKALLKRFKRQAAKRQIQIVNWQSDSASGFGLSISVPESGFLLAEPQPGPLPDSQP